MFVDVKMFVQMMQNITRRVCNYPPKDGLLFHQNQIVRARKQSQCQSFSASVFLDIWHQEPKFEENLVPNKRL